MSGRKNVLFPYQIISNQVMSADITSLVTDIRYLDNISIQVQWNGSPTGSIDVQGSLDYFQDTNGNVTNPGHWTGGIATASTAGGSPILMNLDQLAFPFIRVVYTHGASDATLLTAYISGKAI